MQTPNSRNSCRTVILLTSPLLTREQPSGVEHTLPLTVHRELLEGRSLKRPLSPARFACNRTTSTTYTLVNT